MISAVVAGFPPDRTAVHLCCGNWTTDESICLAGSYERLVGTLAALDVGTYFLELCTPRAGEIEILNALPEDRRVGIGVVNQKLAQVECVDEIVAKVEHAVSIFGPDRILLNPDCGFATFADNPVSSADIAEKKLLSICAAAALLRERYGVHSP